MPPPAIASSPPVGNSAAVGSGGPRIITIVLETILDVVDHGMNIAEAVDAPRIHHQWLPDLVDAEPFALSPDAARLLTGMGYTIKRQKPWGSAAAILVGPAQPKATALPAGGDDAMAGGGTLPGLLYGASDPCQPEGAAIGY